MPRLTAPQLAMLKVLWERGEATVTDVHQALQPERPLAATTIATQLSRLERRGVVAHRVEGRQFVYRPLLSEANARRHALVEVTEGLFEGDIATLVGQLLSTHEVGPGDLTKVKALIEAKEQELRKRRRS
jgi:predicted transcriptional regulator